MENIRGVQVVHACGNIQQGAIDCILHRGSMSRQHVGAGGFEEKQVGLGWGAEGKKKGKERGMPTMSCNPSALRLKRFCSMARSKEPRSQYCSNMTGMWVHQGLRQHCTLPDPGQPSATGAPQLMHGITPSGLQA